MWRQMIRKALAPIDCDHRTNSRSRSDRNSARTSRATLIQPVRPTTTTPPNSASWLRLNARQNALTRSPARPAGGHAYSRIDQAVREIGEQVRDQRERRHDDEVAHDHRVVALEHRLDHELAHAGD